MSLDHFLPQTSWNETVKNNEPFQQLFCRIKYCLWRLYYPWFPQSSSLSGLTRDLNSTWILTIQIFNFFFKHWNMGVFLQAEFKLTTAISVSLWWVDQPQLLPFKLGNSHWKFMSISKVSWIVINAEILFFWLSLEIQIPTTANLPAVSS